MPRLCEIVAIASGKKGQVEKEVTELYHKLQKDGLFDGMQRTYSPRTEDGERLPSESKNPQLKLTECIEVAARAWGSLFDVVLTLDQGNTMSKGSFDIGQEKVFDVPIPTLLFLEKQLTDIKTFISKLPTLDPAESWKKDDAQDMYRTETKLTARTKKVQKPIVLYDATENHPAQTQLITEDVIVGDWSQVNYSTKLTTKDKRGMLERIDALIESVKAARELANTAEIEKKEIGNKIMKYVFGGNFE